MELRKALVQRITPKRLGTIIGLEDQQGGPNIIKSLVAGVGIDYELTKAVTLIISMLIICACSSNDKDAAAVNPKIEIFDESALSVIDQHASIDVLAEGFSWTEGPLWVSEGEYLLFSDIPNNRIHKYSDSAGLSTYLYPAGATGLTVGDYTAGTNGLLLNKKGQLVVFQQGDRRIAVMDAPLTSAKSTFTTLISHYDNKRLNSPNDGVFHSNGNLYFTDPSYGLRQGNSDPRRELAFNGIYLLKTSGELILLDEQATYPNGIVLTKDEKTLIVAVSDHQKPKWLAYSVNADGTTGSRRIFYDTAHLVGKEGEQGFPDGMVVHSNGMIFATGPGGVWLFNEQGKVLAKIRTGQLTANCTLSSDEKTLYMTADDFLMSVKLN